MKLRSHKLLPLPTGAGLALDANRRNWTVGLTYDL